MDFSVSVVFVTNRKIFIASNFIDNTMATELKQVMEKLDAIKIEIDFIKEHMVDNDTLLTSDEEKTLDQGIKEYKEGKTITLEQYKKRRG